MKKIKILAIILLLLIIATSLYFVFVQKKKVKTEVKIPNLVFEVDGVKINRTQPFIGDIDVFNLHLNTVPVKDKLNCVFSENQKYKVEYTVMDTQKKVVLSGTFDKAIELSTKLVKNKEYIVILENRIEDVVYKYPIRIYFGENYFNDHYKFVKELSDIFFTNGDIREYAVFFPNLRIKAPNQTKIDINSDLKQLQFNNEKIKILHKTDPEIVAINGFMTSFVFRTLYTVNDKEFFIANEFFRIRDNGKMITLVDYNRDIENYFDGKISGKTIKLGRTNARTSIVKGKNYIAFNKQGQGYLLDTKNNEFCQFYSIEKDPTTIFLDNNEYDIKIIKVDDDLNVVYAVLGRIPFGDNQRRYGIEIRAYNYKENKDVLLKFVKLNQGTDVINAQAYNFIYTDDNSVYFVIGDKLIMVTTDDNPQVVDFSNKKDVVFSRYTADISYIEENKIKIFNFNFDKERSIKIDSNIKEIKPHGFLGSGDIVYSVKTNDNDKSTKVCIANALNEVIKEFKTEEIITEVNVLRNAVQIRLVGAKDGKPLPDEYMIATMSANKIEMETYFAENDDVIIELENEVKDVKYIYTDFSTSKYDMSSITADFSKFSVYHKGFIQSYKTDLLSSIVKAKENKSFVRDSTSSLVWQYQRVLNNVFIPEMPYKHADKPEETGKKCVEALIDFYKLKESYNDNLELKENILKIFPKSLAFYNLSISDLLYFSQDKIPCIVKRGDNYSVLLGMKDSFVILMNPIKNGIEYINFNNLSKEVFLGFTIY